MKNNPKDCDLKSCLLCKSCEPFWLPAIEAQRKTMHVKKGTVLFREGDEMKNMYFIRKGLFKVHSSWNEDKELIIRIAGPGEILGHRGLGNDTVYPVSATALDTGEICFVNLAFFESTLKANQAFLYSFLMFFAAELKESERRMRNLAHMPVKGRIMYALQYLQKKFGVDAEGYVNIQLSRQDLASFTGTAYETLFRLINELSDEKKIKTDGKRLAILDHQHT